MRRSSGASDGSSASEVMQAIFPTLRGQRVSGVEQHVADRIVVRMEVNMNRRDFWKTMVAAVGVGGIEASNLLPAIAEQNGPATADVAKIYQLQAAFHRAKTAQDLGLMMSLFDSASTLRVQGDPKS